MRTLEKIPHVNAVRLRSLKFNYEPQSYTPVVIDELADLNKLTMVLRCDWKSRPSFWWPTNSGRRTRRLARR
jgi:hypothetical protein